MHWENFKEKDIALPEDTIEGMIEGFSAAAQDLVQLIIEPKSDASRLSNRKLSTKFQYRVQLISAYLEDYSSTVFEFGYNVNIYPVKMYIPKGLLEELGSANESVSGVVTVDLEEDFRKMVELIFQTKLFIETVSGLMKIAKKNMRL